MIQLVLTLCLLIISSFAALAQDAVATLYSSTGVFEVTLSKSMRTTQGREGLLLYERDLFKKMTEVGQQMRAQHFEL